MKTLSPNQHEVIIATATHGLGDDPYLTKTSQALFLSGVKLRLSVVNDKWRAILNHKDVWFTSQGEGESPAKAVEAGFKDMALSIKLGSS